MGFHSEEDSLKFLQRFLQNLSDFVANRFQITSLFPPLVKLLSTKVGGHYPEGSGPTISEWINLGFGEWGQRWEMIKMAWLGVEIPNLWKFKKSASRQNSQRGFSTLWRCEAVGGHQGTLGSEKLKNAKDSVRIFQVFWKSRFSIKPYSTKILSRVLKLCNRQRLCLISPNSFTEVKSNQANRSYESKGVKNRQILGLNFQKILSNFPLEGSIKLGTYTLVNFGMGNPNLRSVTASRKLILGLAIWIPESLGLFTNLLYQGRYQFSENRTWKLPQPQILIGNQISGLF